MRLDSPGFVILAIIGLYVMSYSAFRLAGTEQSPRDGHYYVIFPDTVFGRVLFYGFLPISTVDEVVTGARVQVGPHSEAPRNPP
jgi:hypothetical protein